MTIETFSEPEHERRRRLYIWLGVVVALTVALFVLVGGGPGLIPLVLVVFLVFKIIQSYRRERRPA